MAALKAERPSSRVKDRTNPMESYWRDIQHYEPLSRAREIDLDEREHQIIRSCFGLEDQAPMTLEKIGATLGLTRERVRQLQLRDRALRKMRIQWGDLLLELSNN